MNENPTFIMAGNGSYENRGCEAIVRGTVKILRQYYKHPRFICVSHFLNNEEFEKQCEEEHDKFIIHKKTNRPEKKIDVKWWVNRFLKFANPYSNMNHYMYNEVLSYIDTSSAVLSIGGDNYSLDYGIPKLYTGLDDIVLDRGKTLAIWGASIGPFTDIPEYEEYMMEHLHKINLIFARESSTFEYLKRKRDYNNLYRVSDPAFVLDAVTPNKEKEINITEGAIGLNFSPLMAKYVTKGNVQEWTKIAAKTVELIAAKTSRKIYLIPHVMVSNSNDYIFMKEVLEKIDCKSDQIVLISPNYNASETKWIISKMAVFAGARTHSTIAALSSYVPTLSFVYSIKATGINKDIFGHDLYCLNLQEMKPEIILKKIEYLLENENEIRSYLFHKIPIVKNEALMAGKILYETLEG